MFLIPSRLPLITTLCRAAIFSWPTESLIHMCLIPIPSTRCDVLLEVSPFAFLMCKGPFIRNRSLFPLYSWEIILLDVQKPMWRWSCLRSWKNPSGGWWSQVILAHKGLRCTPLPRPAFSDAVVVWNRPSSELSWKPEVLGLPCCWWARQTLLGPPACPPLSAAVELVVSLSCLHQMCSDHPPPLQPPAAFMVISLISVFHSFIWFVSGCQFLFKYLIGYVSVSCVYLLVPMYLYIEFICFH